MSPTTPGRIRPRRLRRTPVIRELVAETALRPEQLVMPHFVLPQERGVEAIDSMPGIFRQGRQQLLKQLEEDLKLGIKTVLLFGLAGEADKDGSGGGAASAASAVPSALRDIKAAFGDDLCVMTDVCVCPYTSHGHCGVIDEAGYVVNDLSLEPLVNMAIAHAEAGADFVAPSDMMDGRVRAIRDGLDEGGMSGVGILSYAVKYASSYYGPFREAASSAPGAGDRKSYQMDPRNVREALLESALDESEGADIVMVKPALAYLDVLATVAGASSVPVAAYNVSGEYSAVKAAAERGWADERLVAMENLLAMRRAGADILITYHAREALAGGWL